MSSENHILKVLLDIETTNEIYFLQITTASLGEKLQLLAYKSALASFNPIKTVPFRMGALEGVKMTRLFQNRQ